jgi:predicted amidophosphoribosyltransferase
VKRVWLASALVELMGAPSCAGCSSRGSWLCRRCETRLPRPVATAPPAGVAAAVAAFEYSGAARALVLALKLRSRRGAAEPLADAMCAAVRRRGLRGSTLTWVPGRPADVRVRGFDHAEVLGVRVAGLLGLPVAGLLTRVRPAADQSGLGADARRANLRGAFGAGPSPPSIVLVDDLITTGATATECARALRGAGAEAVELLTACRKS